MRTLLLTSVLLSPIYAAELLPRSVLNGPCTGADGRIGVCVPTASCARDGGAFIHNACPGTPEDIKCCTKPACGLEALGGDCRWMQDCGGGKSLIRHQCPGPDAFRCCVDETKQPTVSSSVVSIAPSTVPSLSASIGRNSSSSAVSGPTSKPKPKPSSTSKPKPKPTPTPKPKPKPKPEKTIGEKILAKAKEAKGIPYHWAGGNCKGTTGGGFDCSGLVSWAVCQVTGRDLFSEGLRVTRSMYCAKQSKLKYKKIKWEDRRAGDAVFFGGKCDCKNNPKSIHHVGLMMDSGWTMWNALKTGTKIRKDNFKNWNESPCEYVIRFG